MPLLCCIVISFLDVLLNAVDCNSTVFCHVAWLTTSAAACCISFSFAGCLSFFRVISRLCSSQPARDWKSCLFVLFMFFILIIVFWIENYHSLFIPVKFFMFFHSCSSSLWHVHFPFLCFENGPWSLGNAGRSFFSNPFRFFLFFRFGYFSSFAFKIDLGNCQKELFLKPFSRFFLFILAIFPPVPSKLTLEIVKRNFFLEPFSFFIPHLPGEGC